MDRVAEQVVGGLADDLGDGGVRVDGDGQLGGADPDHVAPVVCRRFWANACQPIDGRQRKI